jgi:hypothetical protein
MWGYRTPAYASITPVVPAGQNGLPGVLDTTATTFTAARGEEQLTGVAEYLG